MSFFIILFSLSSMALEVDGVTMGAEKTIKNVQVSSGKKDGMRTFRGYISSIIPASLEKVKAATINFEEKCNNEFKAKRKFLDKNYDCKYFNKNIIETVRENHHYSGPKKENELERRLLVRYIYNRGLYQQNDLMIFMEKKNAQGKKVFNIEQQMLSDEESKAYIQNPVKRETAFKEVRALFTLTEMGPTSTQFEYEYISKTDHWFLNKEMVIDQIYASMTDGINDLLQSVLLATGTQNQIKP